jgi:hypothetical protein
MSEWNNLPPEVSNDLGFKCRVPKGWFCSTGLAYCPYLVLPFGSKQWKCTAFKENGGGAVLSLDEVGQGVRKHVECTRLSVIG